MDLSVNNKNNGLNGEITIPADKSMSHRAVILSSLAKGKSVIRNFSKGKDPLSSLSICKNLGVNIYTQADELIVESDGCLKNNTSNSLDCGNSGTTMRLMAGILASQNFNSVLSGDESLSKRPMKRIIEPLTLMGARIESENFHAPLTIKSSELNSIYYKSTIASAQVKSCILLAGLNASGTTKFEEPYPSRNHTEIMLSHMGANISEENGIISIQKSELKPLNIEIFGDISSAAFFIVGALIIPNSKIIVKNVGLNETRAGILKVIKKMGAEYTILHEHEVCGEMVGDINVEYCESLSGCEISGAIIPTLIDEIPIIALLASQAQGKTIIKDAQDLRNKESDRIKTTVFELSKLGINIQETEDGMVIEGKTKLSGGVELNSYKDHRLAMTLYVAGLLTDKEIFIKDFEWVNISFPEFENLMQSLLQ